MNDTPHPYSPRTLAAQALGRIEPHTKAVVPPLHVSTTYLRDPDNAYRSGFAYGRPDNETVRHAESVIAALEARLGRTREEEFAEALFQIGRIALFRLAERINVADNPA